MKEGGRGGRVGGRGWEVIEVREGGRERMGGDRGEGGWG